METYNEIYTQDFLNKFGDATTIQNLSRKPNDPVDVRKIVAMLGYKIEQTFGGPSGCCDDVNRLIYVNILEPEYRQRFTIAHELGHLLLDHKGIQYRDDNKERYTTIINKIRERAANEFAAELLMPEILVRRLAKKIAVKLDMDKGNTFSSYAVDNLIMELAKALDVSKSATRFRLINLGILGDAHDDTEGSL